jgi:hypothetical protein
LQLSCPGLGHVLAEAATGALPSWSAHTAAVPHVAVAEQLPPSITYATDPVPRASSTGAGGARVAEVNAPTVACEVAVSLGEPPPFAGTSETRLTMPFACTVSALLPVVFPLMRTGAETSSEEPPEVETGDEVMVTTLSLLPTPSEESCRTPRVSVV